MNLGDWANWAQIVGDVPLVGLAVGLYLHHRCKHCHRLGRYKVGKHGTPTCHRHLPPAYDETRVPS